MAGAGLHCAEAGIPRIRAVHSYPYRELSRPVTCSRAPQFPQNAAPVSSRMPFGARLPSRFGAVAVTSASWAARSHNGSACIRTGRPSAPMTGLPPCMRYPSAASLHKICLSVCPVHGPPFTGRPYNWARRSPGDGIPSRVKRTASVKTVIFPVSSARIRRATSRMISAPTGSSAT